MRRGQDILQRQIGKRLTDGIIQSFVFDGQLSSLINVTFLKFDNWLHITTTDMTAVSLVDNEQPDQIQPFSTDNHSFDYPHAKIEKHFPQFKSLIGQTLVDFKELFPLDYEECMGLKLYFDNGSTFIQYSDSEENSFIVLDNKVPDFLREKINA